jgi:hypothetical protein
VEQPSRVADATVATLGGTPRTLSRVGDTDERLCVASRDRTTMLVERQGYMQGHEMFRIAGLASNTAAGHPRIRAVVGMTRPGVSGGFISGG